MYVTYVIYYDTSAPFKPPFALCLIQDPKSAVTMETREGFAQKIYVNGLRTVNPFSTRLFEPPKPPRGFIRPPHCIFAAERHTLAILGGHVMFQVSSLFKQKRVQHLSIHLC